MGGPHHPAEPARDALDKLRTAAHPAQMDVLVVGCGPAGPTLAAQLAELPDIDTCIVDQRDGPLQQTLGYRKSESA